MLKETTQTTGLALPALTLRVNLFKPGPVAT